MITVMRTPPARGLRLSGSFTAARTRAMSVVPKLMRVSGRIEPSGT